MALESITQNYVDRDLAWKRAWPRCFLGFLASLEVLLSILLLFTEGLNIIVEFWHMNVFGGVWGAIVVFINYILMYSTICCSTTICAATFSLIWNLLTLTALGVLIGFDIVFILNPQTCILTPTCSTQPQVISLNFIMQWIPPFRHYSTYDSKKFLLQVQAGCAGAAFLVSIIYILIFCVAKLRTNRQVVQQYPAAPIAYPVPPPPPPPPCYPILPSAPEAPRIWTTDTIKANL